MSYLPLITNIIVVIALIYFYFIIKNFLPSYFSTKGKNLATKEDISEITEKTEQIRTNHAQKMEEIFQQNRLILKEIESRNQLKTAAIEKRLEKHQEAFKLWSEIKEHIHDRKAVTEEVSKCQQWFNENCLYLTKEAMDAFRLAYISAGRHLNLREIHYDNPNDKSTKQLNENWNNVMNAGKVIMESVSLPATNEQLGIEEPDWDAEQANST